MPLRIDDLIVDGTVLRPEVSAAAALQAFLSDTDVQVIPVVFERTLLGILTRNEVMVATLRLGMERFARCTAGSLMSQPPKGVPAESPIGQVATRLGSQAPHDISLGVFVVLHGAFLGHVPSAALFSAVAEENAQRARQMYLAAGKLRHQASKLSDMRSDHAGTLAALAHEIRTPLTAMLGHADLLRNEIGLPKEAREPARLLADASQALSDLLDRTLTASKAAGGELQIDLKPTQLRDIIDPIASLWAPKATSKGLDFKVKIKRGTADRMQLDQVRVGQIVNNLVSNALKFTSAGQVFVTAETENSGEDGRLLVTVTDTGPGIAEADKESLFKPFQRLGADGHVEGSGLGLHVAHTLATAMGGTLDYAARDGGGSEFKLCLPAPICAPRLAAASPSQKPRSRGAFELGRILVVEDHAASRALIERTLTSAGWSVDIVHTLSQARRRIDHMAYQTVLCDIHLPDGSGETLVRHVRSANGVNRVTPVLAITADTGPERQARCRAAGFTGFIGKPFRPADLITRLADEISMASAAAEDDERATA